jgi:hypothetical protein
MTTTAVAARTVRVPFKGDRAGRWPVTLVQTDVFGWMVTGQDGTVFCLQADVPAGRTLEDVLAAVGALVSRHEGLRTRYAADPEGERSQTVPQAGHLDVLVLELGDQALRRTQVTEPFQPFDHAREYPLRVAVALGRGAPLRVLFEFSHLCADLMAGTIVLAEFAELMTAPDRHRARPRAWQPGDQAEYERTPAVADRMARTLDYWRAQVTELPPCVLSVPSHAAGPPEFRLAALRSAAASAALREMSVRTRISPATFIVSAFTTVLSWWTDNSTFTADILYSNRSLPNMRDYVGTIAQIALLPVARTAPSFLETARATNAAALNAYRFAYFDRTSVFHMIGAVGLRRGCERHRDLVINDLSTTGGGVFIQQEDPADVASATTETVSGLETTTIDPLRLTILRLKPTLLIALSHDVRRVSDAEAVDLLRSTERVLTAAAERDIDLGSPGDFGEFLGLDPVRRSGDWLKLNVGWVDLPACERLFRLAARDRAARVFAEDGTLTGYTALPDQQISLECLHTMAMASVDGQHGAVTPDRYIICRQSPRSPDSHAAWQAQPVLMAGPGR